MIGSNHPGSIGKHIPRREDKNLLQGRGRFIDDVPEPRNTLFLGFVMSPYAHARILEINASAALELDGVVDVLSGSDMAALASPISAKIEIEGYRENARPVLAADKVRFVGEHVAVVVAADPYIAQDAVDLVEVKYDPLPVSALLDEVVSGNAPLIHDDIPDNLIFESRFATDGFDEAFASEQVVVRETFRTGRVAGVPLEPRGCLAIPGQAADTLEFYTSTQIPHLVRTALAQVLSFPESSIRVVTPDVGGGFGTKAQFYTEEIAAAAIALKLQRPIKWIGDRREDLLTSIHARDHIFTVEAAVSKDGRINALRSDMITNAGAYSSYPFGCTLEPTGGVRMIVGPYDIRNYSYRARSYVTNTCPSGAYRGVAQPTCFLAIEGLMDRIARTLDLDPAEVRLRNVIKPEQIPYTNVLGIKYDSGSHEACLLRAMERAGYQEFRRTQYAEKDTDSLLGIGICCFTEVSGAGSVGWRVRGLTRVPGFDTATVKVEPSGKVTLHTSQATAGQGHLTTFAQILSDYLGVAFDDVVVDEGDTSSSPYGTNTFASRSAVAAGGAVIQAAEKIGDKIRSIAGFLLNADPKDIELADSKANVVGHTDRCVSFQDIAQTAYSMAGIALPQGMEYGLHATAFYDPPPATWPNGVHIATVRIDRRTAKVQMLNYFVVHDCGTVINPMIVDGQVQGGTVQGLGEALMEQIVYDQDGQLLNANLLDYQLPTSMDVPDISIDHISTPSVDALGGFKGVGEGGVIGAVPAIVNAVADALAPLGVNVNRLPLRPSDLMRAMRNAGV
ncbi:xanthine dehydrogenase family protein molybdopterin-binding subunit [Limibacillus halophilus]|uniref:Carbon-monoxide dehydrogenase large subunit n=1 Tax=Limibacillus halophilus TaxID=1579333 RepID=A0A839SY26_9PROT|nr:xanthine dehydrogenase family protein molybdopterin-binding subunit [Limibacillus halophilus]MBB3066989.1 carbon-monoxide dehydrogenase large subunit [Limibacillus halophilus]